MKKTIYILLAVIGLLSSCMVKETILPDDKQEEQEQLVIRCGFNQTKVSHAIKDGYFKTEWNKNDTITVVLGGEYRYYVADSDGPSTTFSLSNEHTEGFSAWDSQEVFALTGRVVIKDGNYALMKESMANQYFQTQRPPLDVQTAHSSVSGGQINLTFSYPCAFLRMKMKKEDIMANGGIIIIKVVGPPSFILSYGDAKEAVNDSFTRIFTMNIDFIPALAEENWSEESYTYPFPLLNLRWNKYISSYFANLNVIDVDHAIYYHFPEAELASFQDQEEVPFLVAIMENSNLISISVFSNEDRENPILEKMVPSTGVMDGCMYNVNLEKPYVSTDYSLDGDVTILQRSTVGKGIDIAILGEGYVDRDLREGGKYEQDVMETLEELFRYEPYKTFRNRFNVYSIKVVSDTYKNTLDMTQVWEYSSKIGNSDGAFGNILLRRLASPAPEETSFCTWFSATQQFVIKMNHTISSECVLFHEFNHGMGKVADEYYPWTDEVIPIPEEVKEEILYAHQQGYYMNIDITDDPETVVWSRLLKDERFANEGLMLYVDNPDMYPKKEGLDIFEGGHHDYTHGVYRPSYYSVMNDNHSGVWHEWLNAPCREAIYKWVMTLSEGPDWVYDYETFVSFDQAYRDLVRASIWTVPQNSPEITKTTSQKHISPIWGGKSLKEASFQSLQLSEINR